MLFASAVFLCLNCSSLLAFAVAADRGDGGGKRVLASGERCLVVVGHPLAAPLASEGVKFDVRGDVGHSADERGVRESLLRSNPKP